MICRLFGCALLCLFCLFSVPAACGLGIGDNCKWTRVPAPEGVMRFECIDPNAAPTTSSPSQVVPSVSIEMADAGACMGDPDDGPCITCAKSSCCDETLACSTDAACMCLLSCTATGGGMGACSAAVQCDAAPDPAFATETACIAAHCAGPCPEVP
jgi:hypothetical protein